MSGKTMSTKEAIELVNDRMCLGRGKWSEHHMPEHDKYWQAGEMAMDALKRADWIPVEMGLPIEHDTMFAKYYGTERWNKYMFRKRSDKVEVTVELDDGTRYTDASRTRDGKWDIEENHGAVNRKVVAWHPMSEPWRG